MSEEIITISLEYAGIRLDKFLCEKFADYSRSYLQNLIKQGSIVVNKKIVKASYILHLNDLISLEIAAPLDLVCLPEKIHLDIIYEDSDIVVVNKAIGMVVHPAPGHNSGTLVNALLAHCNDLSGINGVLRPGIVHRIDKDTSGLLLVAKNDLAHQGIAKEIKDRKMHKVYYAICEGVFTNSHGEINLPIGRDKNDRLKMSVNSENSKEAISSFQVLKQYSTFALVEIVIQTGRTHQIRVHLSYIGHPLVGDTRYGSKMADKLKISGQMLHAGQLTICHPISKSEMHFIALINPTFVKILKKLEKIELAHYLASGYSIYNFASQEKQKTIEKLRIARIDFLIFNNFDDFGPCFAHLKSEPYLIIIAENDKQLL
ncbi:MAG: RluA family pseudouridine synthase [Clostridia bacterium]